MNKNRKIIAVLGIIVCVISINTLLYAHSGRTDANGGHRDNNNKSGLGSYHYHCGGHPAHLHKNGVCPYSSSAKKSTSTKTKAKSTKKTTTNKNTTNSSKTTKINITDLKIEDDISEVNIGEYKPLTLKITPSTEDTQEITWKSSDEKIATVSKNGFVKGIKKGTVTITATAPNGIKTNKKITIKEKAKNQNMAENNSDSNNTNENVISSASEEKSAFGTVAALGIIGGSGYAIYKKKKKSN